jgi:predicted cation transporter
LVNIAIPTDMPVLALGIILFISTAVVSHFADNALASRIFVAVIFSMPVAATNGSFLIASVLIGALFGGFLLIPGNIPNFPIARILSVDSGVWFKSAIITSPINNLNYNIIWDGKNRCKKIITKRVV